MWRTENLGRNWNFEASFMRSLQGSQTSLQRLRLAITPVWTDTIRSHGSVSLVRLSLSLPGRDVPFGEFFQDSACTRLCFQGFMLVWNARCQLPVNWFAKWPLISWPHGPAHPLSVLHKILVVFLSGQSTGLQLGLRSGRVNLEKPGKSLVHL